MCLPKLVHRLIDGITFNSSTVNLLNRIRAVHFLIQVLASMQSANSTAWLSQSLYFGKING